MITYALIDPRDAQIRYIGVTKNALEFRLREHMAAVHMPQPNVSRCGPVKRPEWMGGLKAQGLKPIIVPLFLFNAEGDTIRYLKKYGAKLTNRNVPKSTVAELYGEDA